MVRTGMELCFVGTVWFNNNNNIKAF
jgi:hypothetical protein